MNNNRSLVLLLFIILSQILSVYCGEQYNEEKAPPYVQVVRSTISLLKKSHQSSWDKIKNIIHDVQSQIFPPNLEGTAKSEGSESVGASMKEAVKNSVGTGKVTVEETAKSAADIAGVAVHKTAEKVKEAVSDKQDQSQEAVSDKQDQSRDEL